MTSGPTNGEHDRNQIGAVPSELGGTVSVAGDNVSSAVVASGTVGRWAPVDHDAAMPRSFRGLSIRARYYACDGPCGSPRSQDARLSINWP